MSPFRVTTLLLLFVALGAAASLPAVQAWDRAVTVWLQRAAPAPDVPAVVLVFLGNAELVIPAAALVGLMLWTRNPWRGRRALWLAAGLALVSVLAFALKHVIPHPGPPAALQRHVFRIGVSVPQPFSFPSGHTMRTTFFAGILLRRLPLLAGTLVLAMMAALVYLGDHWTTDVLGGLCLGWTCVEVMRVVWDRLTYR